ncbi:MAG: flagellar basal body rod modification protein [Candidatus Dactylopiibacterium carminicum]|uniref:Basal-body rod modification protein FlgD n=1 Tax=Candidatus Dactylopiibacterium carminicum TaxID=857335 RepID=A0A272EWH8_9RHOO|nr:flagellar hook capping FlgD N-terminal domain-containing protein [Candidatus Dactylopiibacterium carminicum]KAF7599955.1 flagellar basal body rod modification protein [Candidatus Dactylopiibacterium carminicum]PAS94463.1 MAG: flagellar basal body rod modification protein [Candidatus Dactylopiibacterium carminicum]PAS97051.1 MAG: flagellar basal body rod modification protein [Candidatus Dactylopiibacterium carminicum]PAS99958.1 MAG: hypothetical protein BSR46_05065 [Candidatus Dactylopiibacte
MEIYTSTSSTSSSTSSSTVSSSTSGSVSYMFITLLVAQIQNQDPLDPVDASEFVNQLTQLSQMEALQTLASQSESTNSALESLQVMAMASQLGSDVSVRTTSLEVGEDAVQGSFTLSSSSSATSVVLTNSAGKTYSLDLGTQSPGTVSFTLDPDELGIPAGSYSISVKTSNDSSPGVDIIGQLQGVKISDSGVILSVSGIGDVSSSVVTGFFAHAS